MRIGVGRAAGSIGRGGFAGGGRGDLFGINRVDRHLERLHQFRGNRVVLSSRRLWIRIRRLAEFQREQIGDEFLRIGRQRSRIGIDDPLADGFHDTGLIDRGDRQLRQLVEQNVFARGAIRLDQHLEFRGRGAALAGNVEIDLDQHRGAADAHGGDRRIDFHVAVFCGFARDKGDGPRHQTEQRRIVRPVRVVDHFVEHHPRIRRQAEHGAVDEGNAERRTGSALDDVALFDVVAVVQDDRDAIADRGPGADELADMTDHLGDARAAIGLRELLVTRQRVDDVPGEMGAVRR